mgnify:CR=1 FL=1
MSFNTISVVGLGYIGLPTASMIASCKINVIGIDIDKSTVDTINKGNIHINEPGLNNLVSSMVKDGYLRASYTPEPADVFILSVPTPFDTKNKEPDLSYIKTASKSLGPVLKSGDLVILESTSPVGTTEKMAIWLAESRPDLSFPQTLGEDSDIRIAYCPERILPGNALHELIKNDRVIGGLTNKCSNLASKLYKNFVVGDCIITNARTAEMAKLTENSFRDTNIAFANELSIICDKLNINVWELISISNRHPRVNILNPGPGVGGHCIAVDPWFIVSSAPNESRLIQIAREVNDSKPNWVIEKIRTGIGEYLIDNPEKSLSDVCVACYGITFKPDIDDLRESPALKIVMELSKFHKGKTLVVDPNIQQLPDECLGIELVEFNDAIELATLHVLLVDHKLFYTKDMSSKKIIDTKGIWIR